LRVRIVVSLDGQIETEVELTKPVTVVGRHPGCDVCIDHPAVSGRHMLFRIVERTVYVEDLASTNGTKLNGHAVQHQVVHHLDMVEVGKHRLHFFDDDLLAAGGVSNLETTVHTDFERTMMVGHPPAQAEAASPPVLTQEAPRPAREDLSRTMAIPAMRREAESILEPATHKGALALRMLTGMHAGEVLAARQSQYDAGQCGLGYGARGAARRWLLHRAVRRRRAAAEPQGPGARRAPHRAARPHRSGQYALRSHHRQALMGVATRERAEMSTNNAGLPDAKDAAQAADLLVTVAETLNERLAITADELARSQAMLREASAELMTAFRGAADRIVAAQREDRGDQAARAAEYGTVLDHLLQRLPAPAIPRPGEPADRRAEAARGQDAREAGRGHQPRVARGHETVSTEQWIERSRAMLDCIVAGIRQIDDDARGVRTDKKSAGSVDLF
jgi:hypothetical protein